MLTCSPPSSKDCKACSILVTQYGVNLLQVFYTPDLWVPLVNLHGVYILPGIPRLFKAMIEANKEPFKGPQSTFRVLYTNTVEGDLAGAPQVHPQMSVAPKIALATYESCHCAADLHMLKICAKSGPLWYVL